jgi:hypothetical protein
MSKKHMTPWTDAEVRRMRELAKKRVSARIAATKLGRSAGATRYKAMIEGVSFRSINRAA